MLFNSFEYILFFPSVFFLHWFLFSKSKNAQNIFLIIASYVFYASWDWRFLSLIIISSIVDYTIGIKLDGTKERAKRKILLYTSLFVNLGFLGVFKYYNFFISSFSDLLSNLGIQSHPSTLMIILPVGISFYTFQTLSYTIDIYFNKIKPTRDIYSFFTFVCFFPQLVAGPIERAANLLPQFQKKRIFQYSIAVDGMKQILWGLFKKVVIADSCAYHVDKIFSNYQDYSGSTLFLGAVLFAFQIYGDFSGYSDIAIGTAKQFGIKLMRNFAYPYFSRDIAEFWRRWHISLSSWFRDYLYIPLGGSKGSKLSRSINIIITFTVSGLWHGANWTFLFWGFLNGLYYIPLMLMNKEKTYKDSKLDNKFYISLSNGGKIIVTFLLTLLAWIFFRSESIGQAFNYIYRIFNADLFSIPNLTIIPAIIGIFIFVIIEWFQRDKNHALELSSYPRSFRLLSYYMIALTVLIFFGEEKTFIYFQF